jgi:uncharacterized membrane protein
VTQTMLVSVATLLVLLWLDYRVEARKKAALLVSPADRVMRGLRDRLARGELSAEDYNRLLSLMS